MADFRGLAIFSYWKTGYVSYKSRWNGKGILHVKTTPGHGATLDICLDNAVTLVAETL
jgi:hypothetical protein